MNHGKLLHLALLFACVSARGQDQDAASRSPAGDPARSPIVPGSTPTRARILNLAK